MSLQKKNPKQNKTPKKPNTPIPMHQKRTKTTTKHNSPHNKTSKFF